MKIAGVADRICRRSGVLYREPAAVACWWSLTVLQCEPSWLRDAYLP
jgi:hypothetical protein